MKDASGADNYSCDHVISFKQLGDFETVLGFTDQVEDVIYELEELVDLSLDMFDLAIVAAAFFGVSHCLPLRERV